MTETDIQPEPSEARNPVGWIVLGVLMMIALARLASSFTANEAASVTARQLTELRAGVVAREFAHRFTSGSSSDLTLSTLESKVAVRRKDDPEAAALWVAIRTELGQPISKTDVAPTQKSKDVYIRRIGQAYLMRPATAAQAAPLATELDERGPLSRLAAAHLRTAAGIPGARGWIQAAVNRYLLLLGLVVLVGAASLMAWAGYLIALGSGSAPSLGPPIEAHTPAEADRFALRAATLFAAFEVVGLLVSQFPLPSAAKNILAGLMMLGLVPIVLRSRPSFEEVLRFRGGLGRKVALGLLGFLLELPVTFGAALIGGWLFRNLPQAEHPAATMLMNAPDPMTILALFMAASIVAPYWEETMFRGLLFPALRRILGGTAAAAVASSFLFACIHPQGPGGWIGLMGFACCSCVLATRTRSLVPSIVMHAAHNGILLVLAFLMGN